MPKSRFEPRNGDRNSILTGLVLDDRNRLQDLLIVSQADILGDSLGAAGVEASVYEATQLNCRILVRKADGAKCTAAGNTIRQWAKIRPSDRLRPLRAVLHAGAAA